MHILRSLAIIFLYETITQPEKHTLMVNTNQYQKRNSSLLNFAGFVIIIAGVMYAASFITSLMMAFFISIIFAEPIQWLKKKKVPQGLAITIVFILIIALFFGFGEIIAASFSSFSQDVPKYARNLNEMRDSLLQFMENRGMHVSTVEMKNLFNPSKVISFTSVVLLIPSPTPLRSGCRA